MLESKNTERFTHKVKDYVQYRPHYPKEIIPFLKNRIELTSQWVIADIGSGTGISSEIFLENGNMVYAVEPNAKMREAAEEIHITDGKFISINAPAENTSLQEKSIDLIIAGQAFHWFDMVQSKKEFQRIVTKNGYLVLMWNDPKLDSHFQQAYDRMLKDFVLDYERVYYRKDISSKIEQFYSPQEYFLQSFSNAQYFDFKSLKGRLLSSSFAPSEHESNYQPMINRLEEIYEEFNVNGRIEFEYNCNLYYGKIG